MAPHSLVLLASLVSSVLAASCSCYAVNSSTSSLTFTNYTFLDFRGIGDSLVRVPSLVNASQDDGSGNVTSTYFNSSAFSDLFAIQTWTKPPVGHNVSAVEVVNSAQNVYISQDNASTSTYLTLRTARLPTFQSAAELDSNSPVRFASLRARARIAGAPGAVGGIFYYRNDSSESDIEILTDDPPGQFRASNQPDVDDQGNVIAGASTDALIPGIHGNGTYNDWNTYRLDWTPQLSTWYVNGQQVANKTYGVPHGACSVVLNMWSDGGSWSGNMTEGDEAAMDVQWVELVYNTTDGGDGGCANGGTVCEVDKETEVGMPATATGQTSETSSWRRCGRWVLFGLVPLAVGTLLW